MTGHVPNELYV